jgi:hypothetical protein
MSTACMPQAIIPEVGAAGGSSPAQAFATPDWDRLITWDGVLRIRDR